MLRVVDYNKPFLILGDDDDGHLIERYINANQIIDIEVNDLTLSILVRDDIEYTYKLDMKFDANSVIYACVNCLSNDHYCNNEIEKKSKFIDFRRSKL